MTGWWALRCPCYHDGYLFSATVTRFLLKTNKTLYFFSLVENVKSTREEIDEFSGPQVFIV